MQIALSCIFLLKRTQIAGKKYNAIFVPSAVYNHNARLENPLHRCNSLQFATVQSMIVTLYTG